MSPLKAKQTKS